MGESTVSMAILNSKVLVYQRVTCNWLIFPDLKNPSKKLIGQAQIQSTDDQNYQMFHARFSNLQGKDAEGCAILLSSMMGIPALS